MSLVETAVQSVRERHSSAIEQSQVAELCRSLRQEWETLLKEHGTPVYNMGRLYRILHSPLLPIVVLTTGLTPNQHHGGLEIKRPIETTSGWKLNASVYSLGKDPTTSPQIAVNLEGLRQTLYLFKDGGTISPRRYPHELFNYHQRKHLFSPTALQEVVKFKEEILDPLKRKLETPA